MRTEGVPTGSTRRFHFALMPTRIGIFGGDDLTQAQQRLYQVFAIARCAYRCGSICIRSDVMHIEKVLHNISIEKKSHLL